MPKYFAAPGSPFSDDDAAALGPELEALARAGASSPHEIVAYAKEHKDSALHGHLHLDRPTAEVAELWYRRRARKVAGAILVNVRTASGTHTVRAFHSVLVSVADSEPQTRRQYMTIQQVRDSQAMSEQVVAEAIEQLRLWRARYEVYRAVLTKANPMLKEVFAITD